MLFHFLLFFFSIFCLIFLFHFLKIFPVLCFFGSFLKC
jgi:hypothetical protein